MMLAGWLWRRRLRLKTWTMIISSNTSRELCRCFIVHFAVRARAERRGARPCSFQINRWPNHVCLISTAESSADVYEIRATRWSLDGSFSGLVICHGTTTGRTGPREPLVRHINNTCLYVFCSLEHKWRKPPRIRAVTGWQKPGVTDAQLHACGVVVLIKQRCLCDGSGA